MNLLQQCKAMLTSPTGKPNLAPWSKMVVAGGNGTWDSAKKAWYITSTSSNSDVYTPNYVFYGNWVKFVPGHYRLTCRVETSSGNIRVMWFQSPTPPDFTGAANLYWPTGVFSYEFDVTETNPWVCVRFGTSAHNQTVYLYWTHLVKLY
jgi:hypothetical protein